MGAGRRTETSVLNDNSVLLSNKAGTVSYRNLQKDHLGGVIFGCKKGTIKECLSKQLFGLPPPHISYVQNIDPGLPLFLFNYSDRKLHGIFEAASCGKLNINPYGWTSDGSERTLYPAQVQIRVRLQCQALLEDQFKPLILDNYYNPRHFWFELDHAQTNKLISLLSSLAIAPITSAPQLTTKWRMRPLPSQQIGEENEALDPTVSNVDCAHSSSSSLDKLNVSSCLTGNNHLSETFSNKRTVEENEKDLIYLKLKELALNRGYMDPSDPSSMQHVEDTAFRTGANLEQEALPEKQTNLEEKPEVIPVASSNESSSVISQLIQNMEELKTFKTEQSQKMEYLEQQLAYAETEILRLKDRFGIIESVSNPSVVYDDEAEIEIFDEVHPASDELIYLVGGYDGAKWLSALDSYSPLLDSVKSLRPMNCARSYASVAKLNGELYVFGGGNGSSWYDTVEAYDPTNNTWASRPSLNGAMGNLAGATLNSKIFALGGGNGLDCFSNVEMLDLDVGHWIPTQSMLHKRFALAAVEHNGAIYAVGGYDGVSYLKELLGEWSKESPTVYTSDPLKIGNHPLLDAMSAERFDPREHAWTRIASMNTYRGCHSLAVINGKIHAMGGHDGSQMVSSVETYDPRLGSWMIGEPMNQPRGYAAAAVLKGSMYIIGGVLSENNFRNTIECYKEGQGWQLTNLKAIGCRSFASAIVLSDD